MNAREQFTGKPTEDKENKELPVAPSGIEKFFSREKLQEMELFRCLRAVDTNLEKLDLKRLLAARLTSVRDINYPALKHLLSILGELYNIFEPHEMKIKDYLTQTLTNPTGPNNLYISMLANTLKNFRLHIMETGLLSEQAGIFDSEDSKVIKQNQNWISYFEMVISAALDKMGMDVKKHPKLIQFTSILREWQDLTYRSIQKNFPNKLAEYGDLKVTEYMATQTTSNLFPKKRSAAEVEVVAPLSEAASSVEEGSVKRQATSMSGAQL